MRRASLVLAGAAMVALAGAACGGSSSSSPATAHGPLTPAELAWVTHLGAWQRSTESATGSVYARTDSGEMPTSAELQPALDCSQSFDHSVGAAPTARMVSVASAMLEACKAVAAPGANAFVERSDIDSFYQRVDYGEAMLLRRFTLRRKLPVIGGVSSASRIEPLFSRIATRIVLVQAFKHQRVEARCWSSRDWPIVRREEDALNGSPPFDVAGFVDFQVPDTINLSPPVCAALDALVYRHERPQAADMGWFADGPRVLTHETEHAIGVQDEARAECWAIQRMGTTAEWLGASPADARAMQLAAWRYYPSEPARYVSRDCRNNGTLDINLASNAWP